MPQSQSEPDADQIEALRSVDSELIIGLVGAVGTDLPRVIQLLEQQIQRTSYSVQRIKVSADVISQFGEVKYDEKSNADRINQLMTAGNEARKNSNDNAVLALGVAAVE